MFGNPGKATSCSSDEFLPAPEGKPCPKFFDVILEDVGARKIAVIKAVGTAIGLGLKDSKDLVEAVDEGNLVIIAREVSHAYAEGIKNNFESVGATVAIVETTLS